MKHDKYYYLNFVIFIGMPILIVAGALIAALSDNNRIIALGGLLICFALGCLLMWLIRVLALRAVNKSELQEALEKSQDLDKLLTDAKAEFENKTDYPAPNTLRLIDAGVEFYADGRYVCEENFKNKRGHHFAFEIVGTKLKHMPDDYDDVTDLESSGVSIMAGYHDGEALEEYANDNGIILRDAVKNAVGKTLTLKPDCGYNLGVWTVEYDDIDYGFVKILGYEKGTLTVYFSVRVSCGLCDTVEGTVELKNDSFDFSRDIDSLIPKIKRRQFNTIELSAEEVQTIRKSHPFLPESYLRFLKEIGFVDMDFVNVGRDNGTPSNLSADEVEPLEKILSAQGGMKTDDFYFFGINSDGTYYAFSKNADDKKVHCFPDDGSSISPYENFEEFLYEMLSV